MYKNVVLISIDSLRADATAHNQKLIHGKDFNTTIKTPNLDKFSKQGISLTRSYSTNPYTTSAHASLFTGSYPPEHKIRYFFDFKQRLNKESKTIAEELSETWFF